MEPIAISYDPTEIGEIILKQLNRIQISIEDLCEQIDISAERLNWIIYGTSISLPSMEEIESLVYVLFEGYNCSKFIASWSSFFLQKN